MSIFAHYESQTNIGNKKLNWLRAAVLGANDGIVSVASIVVGVAGASGTLPFVLTAGIAGLFAGALSMGVGEYVSVSTQRDTQKALLEKERLELEIFQMKSLKNLHQFIKTKDCLVEQRIWWLENLQPMMLLPLMWMPSLVLTRMISLIRGMRHGLRPCHLFVVG